MTLSVKVTTVINPTENIDKVKAAVLYLVSAMKVEVVEEGVGRLLIAEASGKEGLEKLRRLLVTERIRDAARAVFVKGLKGDTVTVYFNKQAAYMQHVSFSQEKAESPLGPIRFEIVSDNVRQLLDWLAPSTRKSVSQ